MLASLTTLVAAAALTASGPSAPAEATWEKDYGKALAQTRGDSRPLLIVLDKPGDAQQQLPAELLDAESEKNESAALLAKYDLCHVDVSTEYGQAVADAFHADTFPYFAIIDKSGEAILHRQSGAVSASSWQLTLAKHQAGDRAVRVTVAKPVVEEATQPVTYSPEPVVFQSNYMEATPSYAAPARPYCPNCQRNR